MATDQTRTPPDCGPPSAWFAPRGFEHAVAWPAHCVLPVRQVRCEHPLVELQLDRLARGREAYLARRWSDAAELLAQADAEARLSPHDYEALATARFLISPDRAGAEIMGEASRVLAETGDVCRAARAAFWAGSTLHRLGDHAAGSGWISRGLRFLDEAGLQDSVERGYLLLSAIFNALGGRDTQSAAPLIDEVIRISRRFADTDLLVFVRHLEGRLRLQQGDIPAGMAVLDEVVVAATTSEMSPLLAGLMFCSVIAAAHEMHDFGRAREWTATVERWCMQQPDLRMYRGECQVFRAHVLQITGDWPRAQEQVESACEVFLRPPPHPAAAIALYQQGELHRLQGRFAQGEAAFTRAAALGHAAQPGLALLRLAQGRLDQAQAGIRRALAESEAPLKRAGVLPAVVEIELAAGQVESARAAADELADITAQVGSEYLRALAAQAAGSVLLAAGDAGGALARLRVAAATWQQIDAAYALARTRLLIGNACRALGDDDAAHLEFEGARDTFGQLGAEPDRRHVESLLGRYRSARPGGLTDREVELLRLLTTGKTNREIAAELFISEKTVARHVSNIFDKVGVSSRAAATAFALKHGLG